MCFASVLLYCLLTCFSESGMASVSGPPSALARMISGPMSALGEELLTRVHDEERRGSAKVTVVGAGQVGMAAAFAMMTQVAEIIHCLTFLLAESC